MVKTITSAIEAEKSAEANIPTELYQVFLPDTTLYFAVWPNQLDFYDENGDPQTYDPAAMSRRPVNRSKGMDVDRLEVQIDNVEREWSAYVSNYDLAGVKVVIWKVFLTTTTTGGEPLTWEQSFDLNASWGPQIDGETWNELATSGGEVIYSVNGGADDYIPIFSGEITSPKINEQSIKVTLTSNLNTLDNRLPGRIFASKCQWTFGSEECGVTPPTNSGTIQSMNTSQDVITLESFADTNWIKGSFETGDYMRVIKDYDLSANTVTLEFPLPADVEVGDTYTITAGCNKVKNDSEQGCDFWNNKEFFGGFPELPKIQNIRQ